MMPGTIDTARKLQLWRLLSELFLDTALDREDYRRIARGLRETGLPIEHIRGVLEEQVAPELMPNLWSIAGEWSGWSDNALRRFMVEAEDRAARGGWRWRLSRRLARKHARREWAKIASWLDHGPC
jgi:DNA-binding transcriptional MerR regulator